MNCQEFQSIVHDWCQPSLDPSLRCEGLEHAAACAKCGNRLASVHSLSVGLWALAEASRAAQASPSVEQALLKAFQRECRPARAARTLSRWEMARWTLSRWVLAAGAAAVLAVIVLGVRSWERQKSVSEAQQSQSLVASAPSEKGGNKQGVAHAVPPPEQRRVASTAYRRRNPVLRAHAVQQATARPPSELATDFLPLGGVLDPLDFEQAEVVRVSLPGSALADLGLPFNEDAEATTITAEVLIAEDGTAQAIRILR